MNVFQRLHEEYLALNARVRPLETQVLALGEQLTGAIPEVGRLRDQVQSSAEPKPPGLGNPGLSQQEQFLISLTNPPASQPVGRPKTKARRVRQSLLDSLDKQDHRLGTVLCRECRPTIDVSEETSWRAAAELALEGASTKDGGAGGARSQALAVWPPPSRCPRPRPESSLGQRNQKLRLLTCGRSPAQAGVSTPSASPERSRSWASCSWSRRSA